jgi:transcriptional regulator with XRE-family HTH domain
MDVEREKALAAAVGAAVAQERMRVGMTQEDLAEALNVGSEAVSRFERGVIMPSLSRLVELAEVFGCSVEKFLTSGSEMAGDQAALIEALIGPLKKADRQFVVELVERTCAHLTARR